MSHSFSLFIAHIFSYHLSNLEQILAKTFIKNEYSQSSEQDIEHLINYCNERFLFFGWKQMRESMEILGRPQFRKLLWKLEGPKVSEAENYEAILEVLDKTERNELKAIHWTKAI
ncbi:Conserved_hypothetical protein [Hexamita inflata]|uniref:Uncharacterized protein n=1 Tax=Hexamita inflata TaxID=28002 RepID=A0AA86R298_9EUKA|nr:Conserved hypothetical protein [Hexamita inflata]